MLAQPGVVQAGKLSWLDDLVQDVIVEAKAGGKGLVRGGDGARTEIPRAGRLFLTHDADEGLEHLVRRVRRAGPRRPSGRAAGRGPAPGPVFSTAQARPADLAAPSRRSSRPRSGWSSSWARPPSILARRYPARSRDHGPPARPRRLDRRPGLRRRRGRGPGQGRAREPRASCARRAAAVGRSSPSRSCPTRRSWPPRACWPPSWPTPRSSSTTPARPPSSPSSEFAKAGIQLASAVAGGAARGLEARSASTLAAYGLDFPVLRYLGMGLAGLVVVLSLMVIVGLPIRWMFRPFGWGLPAIDRRTPHRAGSYWTDDPTGLNHVDLHE